MAPPVALEHQPLSLFRDVVRRRRSKALVRALVLGVVLVLALANLACASAWREAYRNDDEDIWKNRGWSRWLTYTKDKTLGEECIATARNFAEFKRKCYGGDFDPERQRILVEFKGVIDFTKCKKHSGSLAPNVIAKALGSEGLKFFDSVLIQELNFTKVNFVTGGCSKLVTYLTTDQECKGSFGAEKVAVNVHSGTERDKLSDHGFGVFAPVSHKSVAIDAFKCFNVNEVDQAVATVWFAKGLKTIPPGTPEFSNAALPSALRSAHALALPLLFLATVFLF